MSREATRAVRRSDDRDVAAPHLRVVLASEHALVADVVCAALAGPSVEASVLAWPEPPLGAGVEAQLVRADPDVGLLLYEVDTAERLSATAALMARWDGPWVVLAGMGPDLTWGGLREAGAAAVVPSTIGLERLTEVIRSVAIDPGCGAGDLAEYVEEWRAVQSRRVEIRQRLESLSPRERRVLELLRRGLVVRAIASREGLSEATVRTQVRGVLRKLGVRSQLAAVATLRSADDHSR